jgi:threonine dehydratase
MPRIDRPKLPRGPEFVRGVDRARDRIAGDIVRTPLEYSPLLSLALGAHVHFKWECAQATGSFKFRGALNKLRTLRPGERRNGIVSASTGNHGLAVSRAARIEGVALDLFLPENAARLKVAKIRNEGVAPRFFGRSCEQTEVHARRTAESSGRVYVSPYNDLDVVFGQGTIGRELFEDLPGLEIVVVPIGGGGLIAGVAGYLKARNPGVRVVGVEPAASAFMKAALAAGHLVDFPEKPTIADAVAGGMEPGTVTFPLCRAFVDEILTVAEGDIRRAIRTIRAVHGRTVEGAGALPLAALLARPALFRNRRVGLVVSGGNISPKLFREVCAPGINRL